MRKHRLAAIVLGLLVAGVGHAALPTDWQATYSVRQGAIEGGEATQRYTSKDGHYRLTLDVTPGGVVAMFTQETFHDQSEGLVGSHGWQPLRYTHVRDGGRKDKDYDFTFDWKAGQLIERQGDRPTVALPPGTLDELIYVEALRQKLAAGATSMVVPALYGSGGELREYHLQTLGEEEISTPAGRFRTIKVQRTQTGGKYTVTLWCAPDLDYFPVRIDRAKRGRAQGSLFLKSYRDGERKLP
jgi:hypothetical protein